MELVDWLTPSQWDQSLLWLLATTANSTNSPGMSW